MRCLKQEKMMATAYKLAIDEVLKRKEINNARNKKKYRAKIQDC
tara:strand:- start:107 stop:238 length:132 start_codon:yes stop_codon:yes gene_type:complete